MTVVRPNSISGINSITVASGEALSVHAANGDLVSTLTTASGIATYKGIHVGSGTTTSNQGLNVGTGCSIVSDAVNQLDVYTNNTRRFRVDSSGRLLIGTSTEGHENADELTLAYNNTGVSGGDQGRCGLTIRSGQNTSSVMQNGYIYFSDGTSGGNEYRGVVGYSHADDSLYFSSAAAERLRITSTGSVGVGTTNPGSPVLEAYSTGSAFNIISVRTGAGAYGQAGIAFGANPTKDRHKATVFFQERSGAAHHAGDMVVSIDGAGGDAGTAGLAEERVRITSGGHVGIGTSMPTDRPASSNSSILNVGIVTTNTLYATTVTTSGYVTQPTKRSAAFCVRSHASQAWSANDIVKLETVSNNYQSFDPGSNYSSGTGKYTAPVDGVYYFEAQAMTTGWSDGDTMQDLLELYSNHGQISHPRDRRSYFDTDIDANGYFTGSVAGTANLTAGNTVWFRVTRACSTSNSGYTYFTGWLIG